MQEQQEQQEQEQQQEQQQQQPEQGVATGPIGDHLAYPKTPVSNAKLGRKLARASGHFVVTEKIHGANMCFRTNGELVQCARRRGDLDPTEVFFRGYRAVADKYKAAALRLFRALRRQLAAESPRVDVERVLIYGELFGGAYPGQAPREVQPIQSGALYYCPQLEYAVFDVLVEARDGARMFLAYDDPLIATVRAAGFLAVPPLAVCTVEKALNFDIDFDSQLHKEFFGLEAPKMPGGWRNLAEGVVVKELARADPERRLCTKLKNANFAAPLPTEAPGTRRVPVPKSCSSKVDWEAQSTIDQVKWEALALLDDERFSSAVSKVGQLSCETEKSLQDEIVSDVLGDIREDPALGAMLAALPDAAQESLRAVVTEEAARLVANKLEATLQ